MKVLYIGAAVRQGISAKNDKPYTIGEVEFAVPDNSSQKKDEDGTIRWTYTAHGSRVQKIELDPACLSEFADIQSCTTVELLISPVPENPSRNRVTGVKK